MDRHPRYKEPPDQRWISMEYRDILGRPYFKWLPKVGSVFGTAFVVEVKDDIGKPARAIMQCSCGNVFEFDVRHLRRKFKGICWRCVCTNKSTEYNLGKEIQDADIRQAWLRRRTGIISRCTDPRNSAYHNYGARGINVHQEWVEDKEAWLRYAKTLDGWDNPHLDLDRVDNDRGYVPGNIRLVSRAENSQNRRSTTFIKYQGEDIPFTKFWREVCPEWRSYNALSHHIRNGKTGDEIAEYYRKTRGRV